MSLKGIVRRDFMSGAALSVSALSLSPLAALQEPFGTPLKKWVDPPARTGMRGAHKGSFEVGHDLAWNLKKYKKPKNLKDKPYDLVVVGGGISGLASAYLARQKLGNKARILILDNHDDFGGHAKRNEFQVGGKQLIGYGGSQSIDTPSAYSKGAAAFLKALTIDTERFYRFYDQSFFARKGLFSSLHLDAETYGEDQLLVRDVPTGSGSLFRWETQTSRANLRSFIQALPLPPEDTRLFESMFVDQLDWLKEKETGKKNNKLEYLRTTSFEQCLADAGMTAAGRLLLRNEIQGFWGLGWDALSGLEAVRLNHAGTQNLGLDPSIQEDAYGDEPYIFHFPDGNASIARLAVAALIPEAVEGRDMENIVKARVHYDRLDLPQNAARIRLNSTVVDVRNVKGGVDVTYARDGRTERITAQRAIMACWNVMLPHILPEMKSAQKEAIAYAEKVPLTYINVALRNQRAFYEAGVGSVYAPHGFCANWSLDFPVTMGGHIFPQNPDEPALVHMVHCPTRPGLVARDQHRKGRMDLYGLSFEDYEAAVVGQLDGALGGYGLDAERDVAAITVNRWPHGYSYEYNELFDPRDWSPSSGPHIKGRQSLGNIAIANADASGYAYVDGAIDAAIRAVEDIL